MIAFLTIVYAGVVLVLFRLKLVKPRPLPIAIVLVVGALLIGGVVVVWMQCAPLTPRGHDAVRGAVCRTSRGR